MMKDLLINTLQVEADAVEVLADNFFRVGRNEYHVWTLEEAAAEGFLSGGLSTSDESLEVFRTR